MLIFYLYVDVSRPGCNFVKDKKACQTVNTKKIIESEVVKVNI